MRAKQMFVGRETAWLQIMALLALSVNAKKGGDKLVLKMMNFSSFYLALFPIVSSLISCLDAFSSDIFFLICDFN